MSHYIIIRVLSWSGTIDPHGKLLTILVNNKLYERSNVMVLGIICIVLGAFFGINSLVMDTKSAVQQTVQYLGLVPFSVFLVGGFILLKLHKLFGPKKQQKDTSSQ